MRRLALAAAVAVVLVLTLWPATGDKTEVLLWGDAALADLLRNLLLTAPVGAALAWSGAGRRRALLVAAALSALVETLQIPIPGRDPSPVDLLCNTMGGWLGWWLVAGFPAALAAGRRAAWIGLPSSLFVPAGIAVTALLGAPLLPQDAAWYGQWTPRLGHYDWYRGRVLTATLGGGRLRSTRLDDTPRARAALLAGAPLELTLIAGPPTVRIAPVVSIYDARRREMMLLGVRGDDLIWRLRSRSTNWWLEYPDLRFVGAAAGWSPGDTVRVGMAGTGSRWCLKLTGRPETCRVPAAGSGWSILGHTHWFGDALLPWLDAAFLAGLALLAALPWCTRVSWLSGSAVVAMSVAFVPRVVGLAAATPLEWSGVALGLALGAGIGRAADRSP